MNPRAILERLTRSRTQLVLVLALAALALGVSISATEGMPVAPLDDAYIYLQYGRQLAAGHGLRYFPGDPPSGGATSLVYCFLLVPAFLAGATGDLAVLLGQGLGFVFLLAALGSARNLVLRVAGPRWAGLTVAGLLLSGPLCWAAASGMETLLYGAALLAALERCELHLRGRPARGLALVLGLLPLCRPEGAAAALVLGAAAGPRYLAAAAGGLGVQVLLLLALTGSPVGSGWAVKSVLAIPHGSWAEGTRMVATRLGAFLWGSLFLPDAGESAAFLSVPLGLALAGIGLSGWRAEPAGRRFVAAAGLALAAAFGLPFLLDGVRFNHYRYHQALVPALTVLVVLGLREIWKAHRGAGAALLGLAVCFQAVAWPRWVLQLRRDALEVYLEHVRVARWVERNLPPEALPALNDAGALAFYTGRRYVDLVGLVSPGSPPSFLRGTGGVLEDLQARAEKPTHFCGHPDWFTGLSEAGVLGKPLLVAGLQHYESVGGSSMIVAPFVPEALAAERPECAPVQGAVDALDVAWASDEAAHGYEVWFRDLGGSVKAIVASGAFPPCGMLYEGGYPVSGAERFRLGKLVPGKAAVLAARLRAPEPTRIEIRIDGELLGTVPLPGTPDWIPLRIPIPGGWIRGPSIEVEVADLERLYYSFHYWIAQPG